MAVWRRERVARSVGDNSVETQLLHSFLLESSERLRKTSQAANSFRSGRGKTEADRLMLYPMRYSGGNYEAPSSALYLFNVRS